MLIVARPYITRTFLSNLSVMAGPDRVVIAILACSILAWSSFNQANEVTTKDSDVNPSGQDQNKKENVHDQESQLLTCIFYNYDL